MKTKKFLGWVAIFLSVVIILAELWSVPSEINYVWGLFVLIWGVLTLLKK